MNAWPALTAVIAGAIDPIVVLDARGTVTEWNPAAEKALGIGRTDALGRDAVDLVIPERERPTIRERLRQITERPAGPVERHIRLELERPTGERFPALLAITPISLGDEWLFSASMRDASVQTLLTTREQHLQAIMQDARVVVWATDRDGRLTTMEGHAETLTAITPEALLGRNLVELFDFDPAVVDAAKRALAGEPGDVETEFLGFVWQASFRPLRDDGGAIVGIAGVSIDITERRRAQIAERDRAATDPVTGALSRIGLDQVIQERGGQRPMAVLHVGLDCREMVAAALGRAGSEELLRTGVARIRAAAGDEAVIARQDGPEVTVLLPGTQRAEAEQVAQRVLEALGERYEIDGTAVHAEAAVGIAHDQRDASETSQLVRYANRAYVRAKDSEPGGWTVHASVEGDPRDRLTLVGELHDAIDGGQLDLVFQPIFRLADLAPQAVEALVRWNHPTRGQITPDEFLPLAEETGLISDIGRWVITELCRQAVAWRDDGVLPQLNFNASPRELRHPRFVPHLLERIDRHGLPTKQFTLEVTEVAVMNQDERTTKAISALRDAGVRIAIDDFGAGHSSLARLRDLPIDELKIDMAFLRGVPKDRDATAVMSAILDLASALGLRAVAEGIENERQLDYLVRHGCPLGQGYLLTRPCVASTLPLRWGP